MLMTVNNYSCAIKLTDQYLRGSFKHLKLQKLDFNTSPRLGSTKKEQPLVLSFQHFYTKTGTDFAQTGRTAFLACW